MGGRTGQGTSMSTTIDVSVIDTPGWAGADDDDRLVQRASAGERRAADAYLRRHWNTLQRSARYIAGWRGDPDELLASAVTSTWSKWATGTGPNRNVAGYIAQSMRNRLLDDIKSPRSKEVSLDDEQFSLAGVSDVYDVELQMDRDIVATALAGLPKDHRVLLIRVLVEGTPARDLTAEFQQPAAWIHTTLYRAKKRLRISLLEVCLRRACTSEECRPRQQRFSTASGGVLLGQEDSELLANLWMCGDCSQGLRDFEGLMFHH
jgi:RNA polymerase sigma factor (sigma-70 family)